MQNKNMSRHSLNDVFRRQPLFIKVIVVIVFIFIICITSFVACITTFYGKYIVLNAIHRRVFKGPIQKPDHISTTLDYDMPIEKEEFLVVVPKDYNPNKPYGLVVYINALANIGLLHDGWEPVLRKKGFLYIAPFNVGNIRDDRQRESLAVIAALLMKREYNIDPKRIYVAGQSGGARMATNTAFLQSDIFKGTIASCGANYFRPIVFPKGHGLDSMGKPYVYDFGAKPDEIEQALKTVKFCIITGKDDYRYPNLLPIYEQGFKKDCPQARFFDIPGMQHENSSDKTLESVLDYLDGKAN